MSFGPFTLDSTNSTLSRGDVELHLPPRSLAVLAHLIRRPNTLVTRSELLESIWQDVHVTDDALTQAVSLIRQALRDDPRNPIYIETVPRLGYRFIDSITVVTWKGETATSAEHSAPQPSRPWAWLVPAGVGWLFVAAVAFFAAIIPLRGADDAADPVIAFLAEGPARGRSLAFWSSLSPEGNRIAYVSVTTGQLMLRDLRDGTDRQLTRESHSLPFRYCSPMTTAWSPDGRQIAYTWKNESRRPSTWQVRAVSSDGGTFSIKLECPGERLILYDWAPDGESLLLARTSEHARPGGDEKLAYQPDPISQGEYATSLVELSVATGEVRTIQSLDQGAPSGARYSPDGERIAYDALFEGSRGIFVMTRDGEQKVRVSHPSPSARVLEWSPDGRYLLFVVRRGELIGVSAVRMVGLTARDPSP